MRTLKSSGSYLKNQVRKNLAKSVLCLLLFGLIFFASSLHILLSLNLTLVDAAGLLVSLIPLAISYFYLRRYRIYGSGLKGEKQVVKLLGCKLSDDYFLLNDLYLSNSGGDIDHIVLGPNGGFVLETKNWSGSITCNADEWQRAGKHDFRGSPSHQVKKNAGQIKRIIESSETLKPLGIHVEGIVVFTNNYAHINISNPTVVIVRLPQLPNHILTHGVPNTHSNQQLEKIGQEILKQKR